jgi:post-segregation antitoxin (ccd killing protein)
MGAVRKITVDVPEDLLTRAQKSSGLGITATVRTGLQLVAATGAYEALRRLRGRVRFSVDWRELREDR